MTWWNLSGDRVHVVRTNLVGTVPVLHPGKHACAASGRGGRADVIGGKMDGSFKRLVNGMWRGFGFVMCDGK